jgi:hypothetical protein
MSIPYATAPTPRWTPPRAIRRVRSLPRGSRTNVPKPSSPSARPGSNTLTLSPPARLRAPPWRPSGKSRSVTFSPYAGTGPGDHFGWAGCPPSAQPCPLHRRPRQRPTSSAVSSKRSTLAWRWMRSSPPRRCGRSLRTVGVAQTPVCPGRLRDSWACLRTSSGVIVSSRS